MTTFLLIATAAVIVACMGIAYARSRDPVHPMLFLGPMIFYMYVFRMGQKLQSATIGDLLAGTEGVSFVVLVNALGVTAFCLGAVWTLRWRAALPQVRLTLDLDDRTRASVRNLALALGGIALLAFHWTLIDAGGLVRVYSRAKGGAPAISGYVGEAPLLAYPAILLVFVSRSGSHWRWGDSALVFLFSTPHLINGVLGTRRGPLFLVLATAFLGWFLTTKRRPSVVTLLVTVVGIGVLVLFVFSQRKVLYLHSRESVSADTFSEVVLARESYQAHTTIYAGGSILTASEAGHHAWGARMLVTLLVRPVPQQLWPTKYQDALAFAGADASSPDAYSAREWIDAVGWLPVHGAARGYVADFFVEFSWFGVVFCWLYGFLWGYFWWRARAVGGLSAMLLVLLLSLGIYVPTQSVSAVLHRFLFMSIILWALWRLAIGHARQVQVPTQSLEEAS